MAGDERVRHCTLCDLNVYNFATMTRAEIGELLRKTEGRVCARLYRRADGTLLTRDCPRGIEALRRRISRWKSAALAAFVTFSGWMTGCASSGGKRGLWKNESTVTLDVRDDVNAQRPAFAGVVTDDTGLPLPGVSIVLQDKITEGKITVISDANGAFAISDLNDGAYRVAVTLDGLDPVLKEHLSLQRNQTTHAQITLRFTTTETITVGAIAVDPIEGATSTTFSPELMNGIPIGN